MSENVKPNSFEWTDELVKKFTQLYSSNFNSKLLDSDVFKYTNYCGKKLDDKILQFKKDCISINKNN